RVRELQAKYQAEEAQAEKTGVTKQFAPELFQQAGLLARRGQADLAAGRLAEANQAFREARWYLPVRPPSLPEHVARVFGSLKLRHSGSIVALAGSPDGKRL